MERIGIAAFAFAIASFVSWIISRSTMYSNRATEFPANENSEPLSAVEKDWTVVHIRDDLGSIHNLIVLANGLLGGILGVLLIR